MQGNVFGVTLACEGPIYAPAEEGTKNHDNFEEFLWLTLETDL